MAFRLKLLNVTAACALISDSVPEHPVAPATPSRHVQHSRPFDTSLLLFAEAVA
jgi:hypothetical protein